MKRDPLIKPKRRNMVYCKAIYHNGNKCLKPVGHAGAHRTFVLWQSLSNP